MLSLLKYEYKISENFSNIMNSTYSQESYKTKNYAFINYLLQMQINSPFVLEKYFNENNVKIQYTIFIFLSAIVFTSFGFYFGLVFISIVVFAFILSIISISIKTNLLIFDLSYYQTNAFNFAKKCFENYNYLNYYNFNVKAIQYYSKQLSKITSFSIGITSFVSSIFLSLNIFLLVLLIFLIMNLSYYYSNIASEKDTISIIFIIFFGLVGIKLGELSSNYQFGDGISNSYKTDLINLILPIYFFNLVVEKKEKIVEEEQRNYEATTQKIVIKEKEISIEKVNENETDVVNIMNSNHTQDFIDSHGSKSFNIRQEIKDLLEANFTFISILNDFLISKPKHLRNYLIRTYCNNSFNLTQKINLAYPLINTVNSSILSNTEISSKIQSFTSKFSEFHSFNETTFVNFCGDLGAHHVLKNLENYFFFLSKIKKEEENKKLKVVVFSNSACCTMNENNPQSISLLQNITSGINKQDFRRKLDIQPVNIKSNYKKVLEILKLEKDKPKYISYGRSIFYNADVVLVDDIISPLKPKHEEILLNYFSSELFKSKKRLVLISSNKAKFLESANLIYLVLGQNVFSKFNSFPELKSNSFLFTNGYLIK